MKTKITDCVRKTVSLFAVILLTAMMITVSAFAELPVPDNFVCDEAGILDENVITNIKRASDELYSSKGIRVAVCTVKTTGDKSASETASSLLKEWKVGNGILLLLVSEDDTYYAIQSKSISNTLTNGKLRELLLDSLETKFAEGSYSDGVSDTVNAITSFLNENISKSFTESGGMPTWLTVVLRVIVVIALLLIAGYIALVVLEKRNAARQRAFLEERRRMVREGRAPYRPNSAYGMTAPRQGTTRGAPGQRSARSTQSYREGSLGSRAQQLPHSGASMGARPGAPKSGAPQKRNTNPYREQMRQQQKMYNPATAATVQINTADLRAARAEQDKFARRNGSMSNNRGSQKR